MSNPDQARRFVWPNLGPNCLPRLTADVTGRQRVKSYFPDRLQRPILDNGQDVQYLHYIHLHSFGPIYTMVKLPCSNLRQITAFFFFLV